MDDARFPARRVRPQGARRVSVTPASKTDEIEARVINSISAKENPHVHACDFKRASPCSSKGDRVVRRLVTPCEQNGGTMRFKLVKAVYPKAEVERREKDDYSVEWVVLSEKGSDAMTLGRGQTMDVAWLEA